MVDPETFTTGLQHELNSSPESGLVPFLKRNLSALKHSLISGELSIDGVRSPQNTGKSLSEALIFASTNPQYDDNYKFNNENSKLKPGENMLCIEIVSDIQNNF